MPLLPEIIERQKMWQECERVFEVICWEISEFEDRRLWVFDLHNQILTLKETIMSLKPLVEKNDDIEDQLFTHDSSLNFDEMEISSTDYQKLQEEYNKLIFQKHKV